VTKGEKSQGEIRRVDKIISEHSLFFRDVNGGMVCARTITEGVGQLGKRGQQGLRRGRGNAQLGESFFSEVVL